MRVIIRESEMQGSLLRTIAEVREQATSELSKPQSFPFLPELIDYLDIMEAILRQGPAHPRYSFEEREKLLGGFGRIALEDYTFAESKLGTAMFDVMNRFARES